LSKNSRKEYHGSRVIQKAANTERGTRIFLRQTSRNDSKYNLRTDRGWVVGDKYELKFQANKYASDPGVKEAAAEDSHKI